MVLTILMKFPGDVAAQTSTGGNTNGATFALNSYVIEGNTVFPPEMFNILTNYLGTNMDFVRLREGLGKLQLRYHELGYPTISVTLPQQKLTNGVLHLKIVEGKLNDIRVTGNRWFSTANVLRALPSLTTNIFLNTKWFQPELDRANLNQDRQIYPVISPGLEPGTTALELQVKDRFPLHGHFEINDKSSPGTPLLRSDVAVQFGNLWQHENQVGFDYNFSPQKMKPGDQLPKFYDQPTVASYSTYYRLPLGFDRGLRQNYETLPVDFGYDEITHRFNLPPPTGRPELVVYASRSTTDTGTRLGPVTTLTDTATLHVFTQNAEHDPTVTENAGVKFILPLPPLRGIQSSVTAGLDIKSYRIQTFSTNFTTVQQFDDTDPNNPVLTYSDTVPLAYRGGNSLTYLPLSFGWSGSRLDSQGIFSFNYNQSVFLAPLASSRKGFQAVAGSPNAGGNYTTINAGLTRQQNLPKDWAAILNLNGQWSSEPLINNEQFGIGGTGGVRGYQEGESYGDTGWRAQFDLRAPAVNVGYFPTATGEIPASLRCSYFIDYGEVNILDRPTIIGHRLNEWGTGVGFFLTIGEHITARLTLAWALLNTADGGAVKNNGTPPIQTPQGDMQAYFSIGCQF
jgi:hemolysin activation/secretion protein